MPDIDLMHQINPASVSLMSGPSLSSMNSTGESRSMQFRNLYEVVDLQYYEKEVRFIKIRPGEDRREVVLDTTNYPFSAHGRLLMIFDGKAVYGSGTLINSRFVLTAAHNLYPKYFKKEPESILFIPALNGNKCPYGIIGVRRYFYPQE
jgi:V8-like Glu-specific endopeptidase